MAPIGCSVLNCCVSCVMEQCKWTIFSIKAPVCLKETGRIIDLFALIIDSKEKCPDQTTAKSLEADNEYGTMEMVGLGIGCIIAGIGIGFAMKAAWKFLTKKCVRRASSPSFQSTQTATTLITNAAFESNEDPSAAAVLRVDTPILLNPLYQTRFPSEVSLFNRAEKKQC